MSYCRGKGGKVIGEGRGGGSTGAGEGPEGQVTWLSRDVRETVRGELGRGRRPEKLSGQKPKKPYSCATCHDLCCGLARELVAAAFELGEVTMSRKVLKIVVCIWDFSLILQDFDRAMAKGLRRAKALQGGGDREGRVKFRESEVRFSGCYSNILNLIL